MTIPSAPTPDGVPTLLDPQFLENLRQQMIKFATLQLSNPHQAEDAVQEALMGALKNTASFGGRAALKTWVFAILKHKIADVLRHKQRTVNAGSLMRDDEENEDFAELFNAKGFWLADERPQAWGDPAACLQERQFWTVFEACLQHLPGQQGRVFMMREFLELESSEICASVGISTSNLNVMLHRARLRLRECLENRWFAKGERHDEL